MKSKHEQGEQEVENEENLPVSDIVIEDGKEHRGDASIDGVQHRTEKGAEVGRHHF